jgi:uncharacterized protein
MSMTLLTVIALQSAPVPPPLAQVSADCRTTTYASDRLVCEDPALLAVDRRMARAWSSRPVIGKWIEPQGHWFKRSRLCAMRIEHRACLVSAYGERIALLERAAGSAESAPVRCRDGSRLTRVNGGLAWRAEDGALLGFVSVPRPDWMPFLRPKTSRRVTSIVDLQGSVIAKCG